MWEKIRKNKLFMVGLLIPLVFQIIYLCLALPAVKDGQSRIKDLKIEIVNEDATLGKDVAAKLVQVLPFTTSQSDELAAALSRMDEGDLNMVINIPEDFTARCQQGGARVSYFINQSAPAMTKQAMEQTALNINQTLNENSFNSIKEVLKQNSGKALSQSGLPENIQTQISGTLGQAFDSLKYTSITGDIQKVNNADGFARSVLPFFIFLTYFVGCIIMTLLHTLVYRPLLKEYPRVKILLTQLVVSLLMAIVIPVVVISLLAAFGIPLSLGTGPAWLMLSIGFFSLLYTAQMFANWFGIPGMGAAIALLFPLQLVTSGLIYSREILPGFYSAISPFLPATYFGDGMLKMFYGGPSISGDVGYLLAICGICLVVSAFSLLINKSSGKPSAGNQNTHA